MALEQSIAKAFSSSKQSFERMDGLVGEVLGTPAVANQLGKALADAGVGKHAQNTQEFLSKAAHIVDEVLPAMQENSANIDEDDLADLFEKELGKPIKDALADALANTTSPVGATAGTPSFPQPARSGILPDEPAAPAAGPSAPQQPTPTDESPVEQDAEAAPETPEQEQPDQQASPTAAEPEAAAGGSESAADQAPENNAAPGESSAPSPSAPAPATTPGPSSPSAAPSGGSGAPAGQA